MNLNYFHFGGHYICKGPLESYSTKNPQEVERSPVSNSIFERKLDSFLNREIWTVLSFCKIYNCTRDQYLRNVNDKNDFYFGVDVAGYTFDNKHNNIFKLIDKIPVKIGIDLPNYRIIKTDSNILYLRSEKYYNLEIILYSFSSGNALFLEQKINSEKVGKRKFFRFLPQFVDHSRVAEHYDLDLW